MIQMRSFDLYAKSSDKKLPATGSHLKEATGLITMIGMKNNMERRSFPKYTETR